MKLFVDNDILCKLVAFDLLDAAIEVLGASVDDVRILPTARFGLRLHQPEKGRKIHGDELFEKLEELLPRLQFIPDPDEDAQKAFLGHLNIHSGEAMLFAAAATTPDAVVLTGDKNAVMALAQASGLASICEALEGRVWCLETLLHCLMDSLDFETVRDRVVPQRQHDKVVRALFGSGFATTERNVREGLDSFLREIETIAGPMLAQRSRRLV